ncbi:sodium:proton symporter [Salinarimonas ramus]|uniref:Bile acid:Na+ symporter, BASS family n=1 Tax=Salinarimonas ramus TaxID=690164 RepID=A0A917V232_9HYPH|nr:sodium:proton symporter [Salinarimonas ramus]GGK19550.1 hypothetical protein GCM10011322_02860 [Salinarimonas ramus]
MRSVLDPLALIGRYGTQGFALSIFIGLALPQFAAAARPLLGATIFAFLAITFARVDLAALRALVRRPAPIGLAGLWLLAAPPAIVVAIFAVVGREALGPGLALGLALYAAAPPIMSSPAVAMMLNLPPTLLVAVVLVTTMLAPLVAPPLVEAVAGAAVPLDAGALVTRLALLIGGALALAIVLRLTLGMERIRRNKARFDGLGVVFYAIFAIAAMDGVLAAMVERPALVATILAIVFGLSAAGFASAMLILRPLPPAERFVMGYATGQRNIGLLVAALGAATPETTFLFFALAQFPIYLMPQIVKPMARRFVVEERAG